MARLILATAEGQQIVDLKPMNSIGRHPNNSIQLLDKIVSKEHCIVELRVDHFVLRDLGSLNGTLVNNERVQGEIRLKNGDEIVLGATRARFEEGAIQPNSNPFNPAVPQVQSGYQRVQPSPISAAHSPLARSAGDISFPVLPGAAGNQAPTAVAPGSQGGAARVEVQAQERAIGTQIAAIQKGFLPHEQIANNPVQLRDDYERLRMSHELSREIALERNLKKMLEKLLAWLFQTTRADRGVIFLKNDAGELVSMVSHRRDGSEVPITVSSTIMNHVIKERAAVLTHDAAMDFAAAKGRSLILSRISSAIVVPLVHNEAVLGILWLDSESLAVFQPKDLEMVAAVANQAAMFIQINILGKKIEEEIITRERFARLVSPNVAERIASGVLKIEKGGSLVKECTVFNSDIRGFTRMSEGTTAQNIVEMLNDYFELMVESIFQYEGTLDKFMGDGIMGMWGAPVQHPDDPIRCVRSAIDQMERLGRFNRQRVEQDQPPIAIGIGIHTGELVAGYVGSSKALSYTIIGDTVNTSARLCGIAEAGQIVISESTYNRLGNRFEVEELPPAKLKGKEHPLRIFNILRERPVSQVPASLISP